MGSLREGRDWDPNRSSCCRLYYDPGPFTTTYPRVGENVEALRAGPNGWCLLFRCTSPLRGSDDSGTVTSRATRGLPTQSGSIWCVGRSTVDWRFRSVRTSSVLVRPRDVLTLHVFLYKQKNSVIIVHQTIRRFRLIVCKEVFPTYESSRCGHTRCRYVRSVKSLPESSVCMFVSRDWDVSSLTIGEVDFFFFSAFEKFCQEIFWNYLSIKSY